MVPLTLVQPCLRQRGWWKRTADQRQKALKRKRSWALETMRTTSMTAKGSSSICVREEQGDLKYTDLTECELRTKINFI